METVMDDHRVRTGFSWYDVVVVILLIGTVAAIAVPRISTAAREAADLSLRDDLAMLRDAIDMYAAEHNGQFPAQDNDPETFIRQLTEPTDVHGNIGHSEEYPFGPYLPKGVPVLSVGPNRGAVEIMIAPTGPTVDETMSEIGWVYNSRTGLIVANTDDVDEVGTGYDLY